MKLRSAIHYPHSQITSTATMREALLFWDEYHLIAPFHDFAPAHTGEIAEAWSIIGRITVPNRTAQQQAHGEIVKFIENLDRLHPNFFLRNRNNGQNLEIYEVYPQKLLGETWWRLEDAGLTGALLSNNDRPMSTWGGLVIMAKLADACAGRFYARVTDRVDAYRAIASEQNILERPRPHAAQAVPVLLKMIQASSIPIENLMRFRENERSPALRYKLLDVVQDHIEALRDIENADHVNYIQDRFEREMHQNLRDLRDALRFNKIKFATSAAVMTLATGAFAAAAALQTGPLQLGTALSALGTAGLGLKQMTDFFGGGLDLSEKQRSTMSNHPMAYMHLLSKHRVRL